MKTRVLALVLLGVAGLYGCTSTPTQEPTPGAGQQPAGTEAQPSGAQPSAGGEFQGSPLQDPSSPLYKKVFYFPFDSSEIAPADRDVLAAHGRFLSANPNVSVVLEGHADERGTREYNLALGERRAQAVERLLSLQGASSQQSKVVSYGEERPAEQGHDESAWRLNRRVELIYSGY